MSGVGNPLSMAESAVGLHELFTSLVRAGFDERQALYLIGQMLASGLGRDTAGGG